MGKTKNNERFNSRGEMRIVINGHLPRLDECIEYIESCGWTYQGKTVLKRYIFKNNQSGEEMAFTLRELRQAKNYGW